MRRSRNKIPPECHRQRNCQLSMVVASVVVTLMFSFTPFVDWGAHLGGAVMGFLVAPALLSGELDNKSHAVSTRQWMTTIRHPIIV